MLYSANLSRAALAMVLILATSQTACSQRQFKPGGAAAREILAQAKADQRALDPQYGRERNKDPMLEKMERDREKSMMKDRHKALKRDTDRLLALATELKQYVDKTDENMLSLDVLKKSEEIEKLAHSVKNKMKGY